LKTGKHNPLSKNTNQTSLEHCRQDITEALKDLEKALYVSNEKNDLPVAFASNALYIIERNNGTALRGYYDKIILPILKRKIEYLHAEGIA
jgi:hypothetical protein